MTKKRSLIHQQINHCLNLHYGIDVINLSRLQVGADINASVFKADTEDQSYFVKLKHGHHDEINLAIVELLVKAGIQHIISPIRTNQQQSMISMEGFHLIVYPFIEAQDGFSHPLSNKQWVQLGRALRHIHDLEVPVEMQEQLRKENYSTKYRQSLLSLYDQFNTLVLNDEIAEELFSYMKQEQKTILHLVDTAENLAHKISNLHPKYVLCHSDIHAGNVLINGNETIYIVDWDRRLPR